MANLAYNVPNDLQIPDLLKNNVSVFDYHMQQSSGKLMTVLNRNVISFLLEGSKEIYYGKEYDHTNQDQFMMISAGNCIMTEKTSVNNNYRSVLLFFNYTAVSNFIKKNNILVPKSDNNPFLVLTYDEYIHSFVQSLLKTETISELLLPNFMENKLHEFLYYMVSKIGPAFLHPFLANHSDEKEQFHELIEKNSLKKLSIEELAFLNNMSLSTFKRTFTRIYHMPPGKWFLKKRLQFATDLLLKEGKRPSEIYEELGFESLSSFTQAFKTEYKVTPRQFKA